MYCFKQIPINPWHSKAPLKLKAIP